MANARLDLIIVSWALCGCSADVDNDLAFGSGTGGPAADSEHGASSSSDSSSESTAAESSSTGAASGSSTTGPPPCGNGIIEDDEECDQAQFGELTCADFTNPRGEPFDGGNLICTFDTCEISTQGCMTFVCGDGTITEDELCDGPIKDAVQSNCFAYFAGTGTVTCSDTCRYDLSGCSTCGNGVVDGNEECDGKEINRRVTCDSLGLGAGTLSCLPGCYVDTSGCEGNGR